MSALPIPASRDLPTPLLSLDERKERIMEVLERTALDIGAELLAAKDEHPGEFVAWVERSLPFGLDKAERLMAITRTFASCDDQMRAFLPPAWSALYELTRLPSERLRNAIEVGEVAPTMTVADAKAVLARHRKTEGLERTQRLSADVVCGELLRYPRSEMSPEMADRLRAWFGTRQSDPLEDT